ncbi:Steroid receptor RNA activator, putative [Pediculus humanus corporis]|uniref:Steroid receptor RNA activator, putative n=1 Tax=Pediculus humanus subsp. corporis TaxID=121224 RepID=E0VC86_PEDHC|nr:Steroid receptor RNA activator, putative [Pediculus humanus corporis]EEB10992.1 Steroid receptor RNA activator, putative [Pediculus humanus corporis]
MTSKDSHDPGWNDPPIFTYDKAAAIQTAAATKKGVTLNKRVAFPIEGKINLPQNESSTNNAFNIPSSKPPSCQMPPLPVKVTQSALKSESDETNLNCKTSNIEKDKINEIKQNFQIDSNCDNEILKRFKIMETMWNDDKLDNDVRLKIFELSEAYANNNLDLANRIQQGLMVDKISQCSSWMSGIRQLINQKRSFSS